MAGWMAIPLTCWLCALLTAPRRPLHNDDVQTLVYRRLRGRQSLLIFVAALASVGTAAVGFVTVLFAH